ncbi:MAG: PRC-barrel domain-containing protein [Chitinivibrionales bacterium]|nr:PRC-barrel domain-containing protein [Chitinivibrionales bacterium]
MQRSLHGMIDYTVRATDGDLGKVHDFYFDDATWTIRYMVAETGNWLSGRKVVISVVALGKPDWETRTFSVNLTCDQVRNSPDIDTQRPVSRQHEAELHDYYQWPLYWEGGYGGAFGITPYPLFETPLVQEPPEPERNDNPHLRSMRQVTGYTIHATDGEIGHADDFIVDDKDWTLRYLVANTGNWLSEKEVAVPLTWIKGVFWDNASMHLDRPREEVKKSPAVDYSKLF